MVKEYSGGARSSSSYAAPASVASRAANLHPHAPISATLENADSVEYLDIDLVDEDGFNDSLNDGLDDEDLADRKIVTIGRQIQA